ncbi:hypothetical protein LEP1GSC150_3257 [Leptospira interrogans serovar Copenhageni str. LT2050]|uniref:Uncharacterized protein n=1 Tax=Leptospira interrogans serovar Copenhageni str. LT2050 TaxID=1001598 RepID=M3IH51_LEPIT|nr:hypothetical protein LEP1GSC150_3257 [Leptospira interrogans serovar Copenhageni str. LT2050]
MIPNDVTDPRLYFNLACLYAIQRDKKKCSTMLRSPFV